MEKVCQRFALITKKILNNVDNESLINFKQAGRNNVAFLEKERFYWIRIIQCYNCLIGEFQEVWKKVVSKTPIEIIKELAVAVHQFSPILSKELHNETECSCNETREIRLSSLDFVKTVEKQWHPLFIAATSGSVYLCNHIIQKAGVVKDPLLLNPNFWFGKITPIVFASDIIEDVNVFEFLLEKAEDKNPLIATHINWTLLHSLAEKGKFEMCRLIVEKIKDLNPQDIYGHTPYHIAALHGHVEVCRVLMEYLTDKNTTDNNGKTPFCIAASYGHLEVCRLFMETCVDKNHVDDDLRIPLHMATWNGHVEVVGLFMANLVDKNLRENVGQKTPLLTAVLGGHLDVCKLLIEKYKADVNLSDDYGMTPLHLACKLGHLEICKFLCKCVSEKNTLDNDGKTPYDLAVSEAKWNIVAFLERSLFSMEDIIENVLQGVTKISGPDVNLSRLLSAACISSAEFSCWEGTPAARRGIPTSMDNHTVDNDIVHNNTMDKHKDSVQQCVIKVAGRLSGLASGASTPDADLSICLQDLASRSLDENFGWHETPEPAELMNMDTQESVQAHDSKYKTAICGTWKIKGTCNQASDCIYAHGQCDFYQIKNNRNHLQTCTTDLMSL